LVEEEAENIRKSIIAALQKMTQFMESMRDTAHKIGIFLSSCFFLSLKLYLVSVKEKKSKEYIQLKSFFKIKVILF